MSVCFSGAAADTRTPRELRGSRADRIVQLAPRPVLVIVGSQHRCSA